MKTRLTVRSEYQVIFQTTFLTWFTVRRVRRWWIRWRVVFTGWGFWGRRFVPFNWRLCSRTILRWKKMWDSQITGKQRISERGPQCFQFQGTKAFGLTNLWCPLTLSQVGSSLFCQDPLGKTQLNTAKKWSHAAPQRCQHQYYNQTLAHGTND